MICQECGKNQASVHFTRIVNGKKTEAYICEECAKKKGEWSFATEPISLHSFLSGFLGGLEPQSARQPVTERVACEVCGLTFDEFKKNGRLGCGHCYKSFTAFLTPLLKRIHGREEHRGKIPRRTGGIIRKRREIEDLRSRMEQAVREENFEEAAVLRDKIKELGNELEG